MTFASWSQCGPCCSTAHASTGASPFWTKPAWCTWEAARCRVCWMKRDASSKKVKWQIHLLPSCRNPPENHRTFNQAYLHCLLWLTNPQDSDLCFYCGIQISTWSVGVHISLILDQQQLFLSTVFFRSFSYKKKKTKRFMLLTSTKMLFQVVIHFSIE